MANDPSLAAYGGVYRAVCLEILPDRARVQVPQLFGAEDVVVFEFAGPRPAAGDEGWVFFESGLAERPVWAGSESGVANEVFIGPNDPGATVELWYDTDAVSPVGGGGGGGGGGSDRWVPVIIFNGESNSGGYAQNNLATAAELAPRPGVQIFDNTGMASYQTLQIGVNNLVGHTGLTTNASHGWELGLANSVESGEWLDDIVYIIKTGQGGSRIAEWNSTGTYWQTFLARTRAGLKILRDAGAIPLIYFWYSLGINDAIAGTNEAQWMADVQAYFVRVRQELGFVPIFYDHFMASSLGANFNDSIDAMAAADNMILVIDCAGATTRDLNHWDYAGMKVMASRLCSFTRSFGEHEAYDHRRMDLLGAGTTVPPPSNYPVLVRSPSAISFVEGSAGGTFTVRLDRAPVSTITVTVGISGGNASRSPATLTFTSANWSNNQTVTITSPDDGTASGDRSALVTLSAPGAVSASVTVSVTIMEGAPSPPTNLTVPTLTGTSPVVGDTLTCSTGTWRGNPPPTFTYQWQRDLANIVGATASSYVVATADTGHSLTCVVTATNAGGSGTITASNAFFIEAVLPPVIWGSFANTDSPTPGQVHVLVDGGNTGAMGTVSIDLTQPFDIEIQYSSLVATTACVVFVDSDNSPAYQWGGTQQFLFGAYHSGGTQYMAKTGTAPVLPTGASLTFPCKVKMSKSGNDVVYRNNFGSGYGPVVATMSGALTGQTVGYIKCLYAVATADQTIKVGKA